MGIEDEGVARDEDIEEKLVRSRSFVKIFSFLSKIRRNTNFVRLIFLMLLKKKKSILYAYAYNKNLDKLHHSGETLKMIKRAIIFHIRYISRLIIHPTVQCFNPSSLCL